MRIGHTKHKKIRKKTFGKFELLAPTKIRIFKKFSKLAEIWCRGFFNMKNMNMKEFFDFDHGKVSYEGYTPKMPKKYFKKEKMEKISKRKFF
jgi:hypothetical protein